MAFPGTEFCLPAVPWLQVLSYLDYKDLIRCSQVNKELNDLTRYEPHWKRLCKKHWLITECPGNTTWRESFRKWYKKFGRYIHCYAKIYAAWNQIISFTKVHCPQIHQSIKDGVLESELDAVEERFGHKIPDDLRCSLRMHNGQHLITPGMVSPQYYGLMGSMGISSHHRSESFLDLDMMCAGFRQAAHDCMPLTFCIQSGVSQYISLSESRGFPLHHIFYPSKNEMRAEANIFITAKDFSTWFCKYAEKLANGDFPVIDEQPYRFYHEPSCIATTDNITVSVATSFLPEMSSVEPPHFFYTYRITMSMCAYAPESESCQLEMRHWIITNDDGMEERVDGPGVVGEYPIMRPGASYSWVSCTTFVTTYGNMQGYFTMRKLSNGEYPILRPGGSYSYTSCVKFNTSNGTMKGTYNFLCLKTGKQVEVTCPVFHLRCLPYLTYSERKAAKQEQ